MSGMLYSHDAEASVIGAAILDNTLVPELSDIVQPEDFYRQEMRAIWGAIVNLARKGSACDLVTLGDHLEATGQLDDLGGLSGLAEAAREVPVSSNATHYADIVADLAQRRNMITRIQDIEGELRKREVPLTETLDRARGGLESCVRAGRDELATVGASLPSFLGTLDARNSGEQQVMGLSTGLGDLNKKLMGLHPGLYVLGARPSQGKTAFMLNAVAQAVEAGKPALVSSLEMSKEALIERLFACIGNIPLPAIKDPRNYADMDAMWPRFTLPANQLKDAALYIDDTPAQTISHVRARAKEIYERHGEIGLVTIDYVQKMRAEGEYGTRHDRAIEEIVIGARDIGREFNCPVLALAQLNRALEQRPNKRPVMADLKESSSIEQEAEVVMFLYRDEIYHPDNPDNKGIAEIIIGKNREGETGTIMAAAMLDRMRFVNLAHNGYD